MDSTGARRTLEEYGAKRWRVAPLAAEAQELAEALGIAPLVAQVLCRRGFTDETAARAFLTPKLKALSDPKDLFGCERAALRLVEAVRAGDTVAIYGDYDVDGVTASAILYHVLKRAQPDAKVLRYVPHRIDEGYGLNAEAITMLADAGARVIVSVDCGITALEPAEVAAARGVDLIITDHHEARHDGVLPVAHALVHPDLPPHSDGAPQFKDLCGAGVAYKLAWQFARVWSGSERVTDELRDMLLDLLSLAALGTIADVVPLIEENRVIASLGLRHIKGTQITGLNALIDAASLRSETIDSYHVGFVIGPRLNACGRMGHAKKAVSLLTDATAEDSKRISQELNAVNERRRATEHGIFEEARRMVVEAGYDRDEVRAIVLGSEGWHPGVIGIVCSRLVDVFRRPTVLVTLSDDTASGSARSIDGFDLMEAFEACSEHLKSYGGHTMAAGLKLERQSLDTFRNAMIDYAGTHLTPEDLKPSIDIDADVELQTLTLEACLQLEGLAPFGRANPAPTVSISGVTVAQEAKSMGRDGRHLTVMITQGGQRVRCIAWRMGELAPELKVDLKLDVVGVPKINRYRGRTTVELELKDLKISS